MNSEEGKRPNEPLLKRLRLTQACSGVFREAFYEGAPAHLVIFGIIISRASSWSVGQQGFERGRWRGQQCNVTPAPDWVNSSARVIATGQGLNFVGLLNCAMMREHTGKSPPIYCISNGGQTANISGLWAANYNYWRQQFFVQTAIFSSSSCVQRCRVNALWFLGSIVHVILQRSYVA